MSKQEFRTVYLAPLPSRSSIGAGNILIEKKEEKGKQLRKMVDRVEWYGLGLFMAICPQQELDSLSAYFYKKYEKAGIPKQKFRKIEEETLNVVYLPRTYKGTILAIDEIDSEMSISDTVKLVERSNSVLFLAICFDEEVNGLVKHFKEKYWSYEIKKIIRHEIKRRDTKRKKETIITLH